MKVRDLRQYISSLTDGKETLSLVGLDKETFLNVMSGKGQSVDGLITSAASFANNAQEQLFYEFVQNAYDASADSLFFYANKDYLIVLNNGEPFYTDLNIFNMPDGEKPRDGQLYNFLAKGKSLKLNDKEKLGQYGQGSKLLYTLLADVNHKVKTDDLLKQAIIKDKKGPYLISWNDMAQLDAWLINDDHWEMGQADDVENNILFAKILMSYYPLAPGQAPRWFSNEEAQSAIRAFNELVDPPRNKSFLTRGTALIIPLGEGKYEAITEKTNLQNVRDRLGGFASITAAQDWNKGKQLKHIYVMGTEVEQLPARSLLIHFEEDGTEFEYQFAFNSSFAERNVVNFFKGLPILQARYRFGFILDSQVFDVDDSRQRITDVEKTCEQLKMAFSHLVEELEILKEKDRESFDYIYQAILSSRPESNTPEEKAIRGVFMEIFRPFFLQNVLTSENDYAPLEDVWKPENPVSILPQDLGYDDMHWINPTIIGKYSFFISSQYISTMYFVDMIHGAEADKLSAWILNMSRDEYKAFHGYCLNCLGDTDDAELIEKHPLFLSNNKNLYSLSELHSDKNVYYLSEEDGNLFPGQEYIIEPMSIVYDIEDYSYFLAKIEAHCTTLRKTATGRDTACRVLSLICENDPRKEKEVRENIPLFKNGKGEYLPFNDLLSERPKDTILFDDYVAVGSIPESIKDKKWFVDEQTQRTALWNWVLRKSKDLKEEDGWGENTMRYLEDIKKVFTSCSLDPGFGNFSLFLNDEGIPVDKTCYTIENFNAFSEDEYESLRNEFTQYSFVPRKYKDILTNRPFVLNTISFRDLCDSSRDYDLKTIGLLYKLSSGYLFSNYYLEEKGNNFHMQPLSWKKNYIEEYPKELKLALFNIGYCPIPKRAQSIIEQKNLSSFKLSNEETVKKVIDKISDKMVVFPIVKESTSNALEYYLDSLDLINIDGPLPENDSRWELIRFAVSRSSYDNDIKQQIFNLISFNGQSLPETIKDTEVKTEKSTYRLYDLNSDYKRENELIDSFLSSLPTEYDAEWFKKEFYDGDKKETVDLDDLYDEMNLSLLSVEQLRFCLDYVADHHPTNYVLKLRDPEDLPKALSMIKNYHYKFFDKYFAIDGFNAKEQIFAPREFLTEKETLPTLLQKWLEQNTDALSLFYKIRTDQDEYIVLRKAIKNDESVNQVPEFGNNASSSYTIAWLLKQEFSYVYNSNSFKTISKVINELPADYPYMVFLRYTDQVNVKEGKKRQISPVFVLSRLNPYDNCFYSSHSWKPIFLDMLYENLDVKKFFRTEHVYLYGEHELLIKHKLHNRPKLEVAMKASSASDYKEFDSEVYRKWKTMEESRNILIKTSSKKIDISFTILKGKVQAFSKRLENKDYGYDENNFVVVQYPNKDGLSPIKKIEKHIADMDFFQKPFIVLQGLYVEQMEKLEQMAEEKGTQIENIVGESSSGNGNLQVEEDKLDAIKELSEELDSDTLKLLAENKDRLNEMLDEMQDADEDEPESKVRQTIGYIGECIYELYLKNLGVDYEYVADKGVGEYDFFNKTENKYVDVKTSLYTLRDGTAPFYLHRSQNVFMQKHPDAQYRIVRISLKDLNVEPQYKRIRDIYGKDKNPMEDEGLAKKCKELARNYWIGGKAKIEEFDTNSPEYAIRIEKRVNHE